MTNFFDSVFWLLVTLGVLVTFHEFGHFWVARRCGVKVLRFSVGFGKAIWKRVGHDGCQYQIAAIPLGGYVKMLDAREGEVPPSLRSQEFTTQPVSKRIAIVLAGPVFNLVFAVVAFWCMFMLGTKAYAPIVIATPQSMAMRAGILPNDHLLSIDGTRVKTWNRSLNLIVEALLSRTPLPLRVRGADGKERSVLLPLNTLPAGQDIGHDLAQLGMRPAPPPAVAATVRPGQPAALAGLHSGDRFLSVNGIHVANFADLVKLISTEAAHSPRLSVRIERQGRPMQFNVRAHKVSRAGQAPRWLIGVGAKPPQMVVERYGPLPALSASLDLCWQKITSVFRMIGQMLDGRASTRNLSGVIGIAQMASASASMGLASFLNFLALVSLSLGVLNLLPIPILDGGHLLYYLIELVKGSPVSQRAMHISQSFGLVLLLTLMGLAFYNDLYRLLVPT